MRLARHGTAGAEQPVVGTSDGVWHDLRPVTADITPEFLARVTAGIGGGGVGGGVDFGVDVAALPVVERVERFGAPVGGIGKIVCIGLNYSDHAAETGASAPSEPVVFLKAPDTVVGPDDDVLIPRHSHKTDWEVELAVVIGAPARYLAGPDDAAACIAGYTISHDVSEREFQIERGGQWDKGKNCETFNPMGPFLVTRDEIADPQDLQLRLWVNQQPRQDGRTADMIFGVHYLVWYLSQFMVLRPGDVVNTGTPAGVALGRPDHPYLRPGDVVELEISGLGRQRQRFGPA